ncbi:hypothetical protein [Actinoplanes subtropicus]|uniref:hypothetical protein n=1 Tax=Actinoplanes subtropicus TaxID=543632 RepID=UPI00068F43F7|nr:hypothetical protein [Actinoplanes subtropicus]
MTETEIVVERCVMRIVRRGGWSWGPDPRALPARLAEALPGLLAGRFAAELAGAEDVDITEPVRVVVPVPAGAFVRGRLDLDEVATAEFRSGLDAPGPHDPGAGPRLMTEISGGDGGPVPFGEATPIATPAGLTVSAAVRLARLLAAMQREGRLADLLATLPVETLRMYSTALIGADDLLRQVTVTPELRGPKGATAAPNRTARPPERRRTEEGPPAGERRAASTTTDEDAEPAVAGSVTHPATVPGNDAPLSPGLSGESEAARLRDEVAAAAVGEDERALAAIPPSAAPARETEAGGGVATVRSRGVVEVRSALPFLVAAALSRIGALDRIGIALDAAGLDARETAAFATALAYKTLGPVERGWRRPPTDRHDAAAFAGCDAEEPEPDLAGLARRAASALPMVDALLSATVAAGHEPGRPLLLRAVTDGLLLVEADGLFPLAQVPDVAALLPHWRSAGCPLVLTDGLDPRRTRELAASGVPLCQAQPPTRGERWVRLPGPGRLWATDRSAAPPSDLDPTRLGAALDNQIADAEARTAVPHDGGPALERTVTLAAGIGLASISWLLWRDREPTDAPLAVERFGDLSAMIAFTRDTVHVRLPLGRRHADLDHHGLLADLPEAFWLGGRVVSFSGG